MDARRRNDSEPMAAADLALPDQITVGDRSVVIFHPEPEARERLKTAISELGHKIVGEGSDGQQLIDSVLSNKDVDLIVTGNRLSTQDGVSALLEISNHREIPAIVVTRQRSLEMVEKALKDHVMAYLIEPITVEEIKPTIYLVIKRFEQFQELKEEVANLQELLETRRLIERAKAVLMRRNDIGENEAYARLRKSAMDSRTKIIDKAKELLDEEAVASGDANT